MANQLDEMKKLMESVQSMQVDEVEQPVHEASRRFINSGDMLKSLLEDIRDLIDNADDDEIPYKLEMLYDEYMESSIR